MSDISPIGRPQVAALNGAARAARAAYQGSAATRGTDQVEFSPAARFLSKLRSLPDVRQDLVDRVRAEIQAGTYTTDDKIDGILDAVLEDLA